jgi:hypothetical protein
MVEPPSLQGEGSRRRCAMAGQGGGRPADARSYGPAGVRGASGGRGGWGFVIADFGTQISKGVRQGAEYKYPRRAPPDQLVAAFQ